VKWCRFEADDRSRYGIIEGDTIIEVTGNPFEKYEKTTTTRPTRSSTRASWSW